MENDKKHINRFTKGWATDLTPEIQPQEVAVDIWNMQISMRQGKVYAAHPVKGTLEVAVCSPGYQKIGLVKNLNDITVYSCGGNGKSGIGILEYDDITDTFSYRPIYYTPDLNFHVDKVIQGIFWRDNEKRQYNHFWDDRNPPRVINTADSLFSDYIPSGSLVLGQQYMVIQGTITHNATNYGPLETATVFTATGVNIYTGAGLVINYFPYELIDSVPKIAVGTIKFVQWLSGGSLSGNSKKYYYQLEDDSGVRSPWMGETTPVHVTKGEIIAMGVGGTVSYQDYQGVGGATGTANNPDVNTLKGIKIRISNIDLNFTKIRVAVAESVAYNVFSNPKIFHIGAITASVMDIDHMGGEGYEEILVDDILTQNQGIIRNRAGVLATNYFIIGNYTTRHVFNWKANDFATLRPVMREVLSDVADPAFAAGPSHPDETNAVIKLIGHGNEPANQMYQNHYYRVKGTVGVDAVDYDDGGGVVTYQVGDIIYCTGTVGYLDTWAVNAGAPTVVPVLRILKYGTAYDYIEIIDDFHDGKGMTVDAHLKSYWRFETYRFGVELEDIWGNPYPIFFLGDLQMPEQNGIADNVHFSSVPVPETANLVKTTSRHLHYMKHLGVHVDIDFNSLVDAIVEYNPELAGMTYQQLPLYFKKFRIVRAPLDKQIKYQGMVYPTTRWRHQGFTRIGSTPADASRETVGQVISYNGFDFYSSPAAEREKNFYEFFSPDHLMRFNDEAISFNDTDIIKLIEYMDVVARNDYSSEPWPSFVFGTRHTMQSHHYSKFTSYATALGGMTPKGSFTYVDKRWTQSIANGEYNDPGNSPAIGTSQFRYFNGGYLSTFDINPLGFPIPNRFISVGSHKILLYTQADESGADPNFANGLGYLNDYTFMKPIVNIIRQKANLYGGTTEESLRFILLTPFATTLRASISRPESVSSRIASFGSSIAIWKISFFFFSPPEKPSLTDRLVSFESISTSSFFSLISLRKSEADKGSSPRCLRCSLTAVFMKLTMLTPGISIGYWKPRKRPSLALSSGSISSRSLPK